MLAMQIVGGRKEEGTTGGEDRVILPGANVVPLVPVVGMTIPGGDSTINHTSTSTPCDIHCRDCRENVGKGKGASQPSAVRAEKR